MFLHISHVKQVSEVDRVLLWSIDSDIGAMCPRFCLLLDIKEFYFKTGVGKAERYIPIHEVVKVPGRNTSMILPSMHLADVTQLLLLVGWARKGGLKLRLHKESF